MKKILFTLVFCIAACMATAFAQTSASSAVIDTMPHDGDSIAPAIPVPEITPAEDTLPSFINFSFEDDADLYYFMHKSTLPLSDEIRTLAGAGEINKALSQLQDYKQSLKTKDPLLLLLLDADFYEMFRYDPVHGKTYQDLVQKLKSEYGSRAEVIRFELDELGAFTSEKVIAITDRMIKADSKYLPAYLIRGREFYNMGQTDKFCKDFDRLPETVKSNDANYKQTCKK